MSKKESKTIAFNMMWLLGYFTLFCYHLLSFKPTHSQSKFSNIMTLIGSALILSGIILITVAVLIHSRSKIKKPLFQGKPKLMINLYKVSSILVGLSSFSLFLKTTVDDNQIPFIGYLTFFLFIAICVILIVNNHLYKKEQATGNDSKINEVDN